MPFFLFQDPIQDTILHILVMFPWAPLGCDTFSDLPSFGDFNSFEENWSGNFVGCPSTGFVCFSQG